MKFLNRFWPWKKFVILEKKIDELASEVGGLRGKLCRERDAHIENINRMQKEVQFAQECHREEAANHKETKRRLDDHRATIDQNMGHMRKMAMALAIRSGISISILLLSFSCFGQGQAGIRNLFTTNPTPILSSITSPIIGTNGSSKPEMTYNGGGLTNISGFSAAATNWINTLVTGLSNYVIQVDLNVTNQTVRFVPFAGTNNFIPFNANKMYRKSRFYVNGNGGSTFAVDSDIGVKISASGTWAAIKTDANGSSYYRGVDNSLVQIIEAASYNEFSTRKSAFRMVWYGCITNSFNTNNCIIGTEDSSIAFQTDAGARLGFYAKITTGFTETNWLCQYFNGATFVTLATAAAKTGTFHELMLMGDGVNLFWYIDGVQLATTLVNNTDQNFVGPFLSVAQLNGSAAVAVNWQYWELEYAIDPRTSP